MILKLSAIPKLSIITVSFNNCEGLKRTRESVERLEFKNWEHIVIDGGSSDETVLYLDQLSGKVVFLSEQDRGIYDAMNKGIRLSKGEYCLFMNAGDTFASVGAMNFLDSLNEDPPKLIFGNALYVDGENSFIFLPKVYRKLSFLRQNTFCHQALLYPRLVFDLVGDYKERLKVSADFDLTFRAYKKIGAVRFNILMAHCELGGVSCQRRLRSLSDRLQSLREEGDIVIAGLGYLSWGFYFLKLHLVDFFEERGLMWPYRRLKSRFFRG